MPVDKQSSVNAFGDRLRRLMREQGHTSTGSKSGVDVARLAEIASTSYEMARRYAEGHAIPRPEKLAAIAKWLGVSSALLAWGEDEQAGIDERLLQSCMQAITSAQERTGHPLSTENAARLVAALYREAMKNGLPSVASLDLLVKLSR
jgi:transcriptional regulator with XRE-family HTH domain